MRPGGGLLGRQFGPQRGVEQVQPGREHPRFDIARLDMRRHRAAVVTALVEDGICPEINDFRLMRWPVVDMHGKHRPQSGVVSGGLVEGRHDPFDLGPRDLEARRQGGVHPPYVARLSPSCKHPLDQSGTHPYNPPMMWIPAITPRITGPAL